MEAKEKSTCRWHWKTSEPRGVGAGAASLVPNVWTVELMTCHVNDASWSTRSVPNTCHGKYHEFCVFGQWV